MDRALAQEEHKTDDGMLLQVEPWYKQFHARLLIELVHDETAMTFDKKMRKDLREMKRQKDQIDTLSTELERRNSEIKSRKSDIERQNSEIERQNSELEKLKDERTNLKEEIKKINAAVLEKEQKEHNETLQRHQREYERLKKQILKLQNLKVTSIPVPAYQLRLLTDFADHWEGCNVMLLEQEEKVMFYGTEEDCKEGMTEFQKCLQVRRD